MSKSEIIGFAIVMLAIVAVAVGLGIVANKFKVIGSEQQFNFNAGLIVLDRDSAIDSIYVDKNLRVIDCVTTIKEVEK